MGGEGWGVMNWDPVKNDIFVFGRIIFYVIAGVTFSIPSGPRDVERTLTYATIVRFAINRISLFLTVIIVRKSVDPFNSTSNGFQHFSPTFFFQNFATFTLVFHVQHCTVVLNSNKRDNRIKQYHSKYKRNFGGLIPFTSILIS